MNTQKMLISLFATLHTMAACASAPRTDIPASVVHQSLALTQAIDGVDGSLEVLRDSRLTDSDIKALQEHDPDTSPELSPRFKNAPMQPARLVLKVHDGHSVQSVQLAQPYATLEAAQIRTNKRTILVTQDFGIGMGSYNGPITHILNVAPGKMTWAKARSSDGKKTQIALMRSLKSAWNFVSTPAGQDILAINCRPDENPDKFTTTFSRYHPNEDDWTVSFRKENILWEAEDGDQQLGYELPDSRKFPPLAMHSKQGSKSRH